MSQRYAKSEQLLERALKTIPLGSQTFTKSKTQFPYGVSPYFIERGEKARVWDIDGNEYLDFMNALLSVSIGYADKEINEAVKAQIDKGVSFSLSNKLEVEVSELLTQMVPCAEMVRFGKNGTDATSAAIRLARAYTNKEMVLVCGYHGWQDWYIGSTTRNLGVPESTRQLTKTFQYNNILSLEVLLKEYSGQVAAVIMEPMNVEYPQDGFLDKVRQLTIDNDVVLIFDETITGCRFSKGGAQELFSVTPDLATFGKGLANGFPLSAVMGKKEIMLLIEDIFYSGTFAGETVSLAAAKVVLQRIDKENIPAYFEKIGNHLLAELEELITKHQLQDTLSTAGHPSWSFLLFKETSGLSSFEIKSYYLQEVFKRGIITLGTHNLSYAHTIEDVDQLNNVYDEVFALIREKITDGTLLSSLECEALEPLFKVR
jgi:glutamate-1-semialdehyde 2,1-aminomutase